MPPSGDGSSPAPIDLPILDYLRTRLNATSHVERAAITDDGDHLELRVEFASNYYPPEVDEASLAVRWYTNDDFAVHYREVHTERSWERRWDRHPNPHNTRDHFHPPPTATSPGEDHTWPTDYRAVLSLVLDDVEARIERLWDAHGA